MNKFPTRSKNQRIEYILVAEDHDAAYPRGLDPAALHLRQYCLKGKGLVLAAATAHVAQNEVQLAQTRILLQEGQNVLE
jgi:hypothetical protein